MTLVLGLESSCDETAVALLRGRNILSSKIASQYLQHKRFGGVVPEIAARAHLELFPLLLKEAFAEAKAALQDIGAIAVTAGPGLIGGVLVGTSLARALSLPLNIPVYGLNHLEGHALTARLTHSIPFPYMLLLVSGGHSQFLMVEDVGSYRRLGTTIDDAVGEAFDKVAKLLGLGYPGGPFVEKAALEGNPKKFALPVPMLKRKGCDLSLSGLKTAVRHLVAGLQKPTAQDVADMAASFQNAVCLMLADRLKNALAMMEASYPNLLPEQKNIAIAGGVAANEAIAMHLSAVAKKYGYNVIAPPSYLCGDNAVMMAWAAQERLAKNMPPEPFAARPRWPLDTETAALNKAGAKA